MKGIEHISQERREHFSKHGYTVENDAKAYKNHELKDAATYCLTGEESYYPVGWNDYFRQQIARKRKELPAEQYYIEMCSIAGALLAGQIDVFNFGKEVDPQKEKEVLFEEVSHLAKQFVERTEGMENVGAIIYAFDKIEEVEEGEMTKLGINIMGAMVGDPILLAQAISCHLSDNEAMGFVIEAALELHESMGDTPEDANGRPFDFGDVQKSLKETLFLLEQTSEKDETITGMCLTFKVRTDMKGKEMALEMGGGMVGSKEELCKGILGALENNLDFATTILLAYEMFKSRNPEIIESFPKMPAELEAMIAKPKGD